MDEQSKTTSTSPDSIFSEFSSHDSIAHAEIVPNMSVFSPIRLSVTLDNMNLINNTMDDQSYFHDQFSPQRSAAVSRWQSDVENLNFQFNTSNQQSFSRGTYLINDSTTNRNIASSSITDVLNSPMSRLSTSSSIMSLSSVGNQKLTNQRVSRPAMTNFSSQLNGFNENSNLFSSTNSFLPVPTRSVNRQTFSAIDNILSNMTDNDLQRVPPSFMLMQPSATYANTPSFTQSQTPQAQVVHSSGRSNSMPSWRAMYPGASEDNDEFAESTLKALNAFRRRHTAEPLGVNEQLCEIAQRWAEQMARTGKLEHSPAEMRNLGRQTLGENFSASFQSELTGEKMVRKWMKEGKRYMFGFDGRKDTENFTQSVWQASREIGVGRARSEDGNWWYGVVVFDPPGNIPNQYSNNVFLPADKA
ncbi:unnamed protein product [Adineta steineri]|uniref:SCP domain-containing protein n=2 Tax=Adineta steineri TaxID=433720 RepID=A0A814QEK9_9BILA|nr:unnamed protein product [Adineta steineri]